MKTKLAIASTAALLGLVQVGCGGQESTETQSPKDNDTVAPALSPGLSSIDEVVKQYQSSLSATTRDDVGNIVVARIGDWSMTLNELDELGGRKHLKRLRSVYETRFRLLESAMAERLYELEGEAIGQTGKQVFDAQMKQVRLEPDFKGMENMTESQAMATAEGQIRERMLDAHEAFVAKSALKYGLEMLLAEPSVLVEAGDLDGAMDGEIAFGPANAEVLIEVYTDFQCPYCAQSAPHIARLYERYQDKARFVFRMMTPPNHPAARPAAVGAYCAFTSGEAEFWRYHDAVFADQDRLQGGKFSVQKFAQQAGMNPTDFSNCLEDPDVLMAVDAGSQAAFEQGVSATPTVVINGLPIVGMHNLQTYEDVMRQTLAMADQ